jgi:integrase
MNNLPKLYDWDKRELYKGTDLEEFTLLNVIKEISEFDSVVETNWNNYIKYLIKYENLKDLNIDHPYYTLKDNNFHIRGGRYSIEYNNFIKSIEKDFPFEKMKKHKEILDKSLLNSIKEYSKDEKNKNKYIFPFLKGYENESDITRLSNKVSSSVSLINKSLKEIGKEVGITKKLTNHLSRHSITSISKSLGTDVYDLKDMLGHTNVKQTEVYINSINTIEVSKRNTDKLSNFLNNLNE